MKQRTASRDKVGMVGIMSVGAMDSQAGDPKSPKCQARSQELKRLEDEHNKLSKEISKLGFFCSSSNSYCHMKENSMQIVMYKVRQNL